MMPITHAVLDHIIIVSFLPYDFGKIMGKRRQCYFRNM